MAAAPVARTFDLGCVNAPALALGVPATRIHEIVKERRSVTADTADTAERLAR
jgi:antitoxin HigA-1